MPEEDLVDIKFRLYDGSDIGPFRCSSSTSTVDMLKQRVVSDWPRGKTITPKVVNEIKLISSGKVLDNNKTVGQCRTPFGEVAGGVIIMHVVVQPSLAKTKTDFVSDVHMVITVVLLEVSILWLLDYKIIFKDIIVTSMWKM
ncbi:MEMBRANE-ANCHORED UBIQUITIN-FOLD PROTEIN 3 [Salix viminalis]|uniref:MEMBRANE-ANCHORED UBIQUITIN-FOLD PROTEIN 3 n=2 Tax=Salix TaxID=40685 RepID=A0A9Q0W6M5_SALPP|nr:MEMBRANE-ANCHORED UBIQUITIN-FOLD PROTEIN 3 [Salix viminalis]KAJ6760986.1 MEMBRANE-ANCHORED UBIQUITIN-FOLD PROTEIN 3 [Salix purpurea]